TISRQHAEIEMFEGAVLVRDLHSTNGTFLNAERVREALAPPGSRIAFGKVEFEVHEEQPAQPPLNDDSSLDATIRRQTPVRGTAAIAARLSGMPSGSSMLKIGGESTA